MKILHEEFLPSNTPTVHASSIAFWNNKPIFTWFGGIREGLPDSSIYLYYSNKTYIVPKIYNLAYWNPILFPYKDRLFLFFKIGEFCDRWQTFYIDISNIDNDNFNINNIEWKMLPAGLNGPVKTKPIVYNDIIYCGSSVETRLNWTSYIESYVIRNNKFIFCNRSRPLLVNSRNYLGIIQPSLCLSKDILHAFFRSSRGLGKIYYSYKKANSYGDFNEGSNDVPWTDPVAINIPNPNSGIDTLSFSNKLFIIYNDSNTYRYPLVISNIKDNIVTDKFIIKEKTDDNTYTNELSYPYMIEHDNKIHCVYTYGRSKIAYVILED